MSDFEWIIHESDEHCCLVCNVGNYQACIWYVRPSHPQVFYCHIRGRSRTYVYKELRGIDEAKARLESELMVLRHND